MTVRSLGLIALVLSSLVAPLAARDTLTVCESGCDFTSVQAAVDAAAPGDTVRILEGTYDELFVVDIDLSFEGTPHPSGDRASPPLTVLAGDRVGATLTVQSGATLTVEDLEITGGDD